MKKLLTILLLSLLIFSINPDSEKEVAGDEIFPPIISTGTINQ